MSSTSHEGKVKFYWVLAILLCIITAIEWAIFEYREPWQISVTMLVSVLSILSIIKFVKVVGWYHLSEDPTMLKLIFIFPVLIAFVVCVDMIVLLVICASYLW